MRGWPWQRVTPIAAAAGSFVLLVAVLPSLPTSNPGVSSARAPQAGGTSAPGASGTSTPGAGPTAAAQTQPGLAATGPGSASGGVAGTGVAAGSATAAGAGSTGCANGGATYQGVSCTDIVTVFHWAQDYNECPGDQNLTPWLAALGVNADPATSLNVLVPYVNQHAAQLFPYAASKLGPSGFYGRQIKAIYDTRDGGPWCTDVTRAAAQRIAQQDRAFAGIGGCITCTSEGSGQIMQPLLAGYHVLSIEATQNRNAWYMPQQPYSWGVLASGDTDTFHLASVICNLYAGKPASNTGDSSVSGRPRIFSVVNQDDNEIDALGDEFIANIQRCGVTMAAGNAGHIKYAKDLSTAASQAANVEAQQRSAGVTTIVCLCDAVATLVGTQQNSSTGWHPEYLASDFGFLDSPSAVNNYPPDVWKNAVVTAESNAHDHSTAHWCETSAGQVWCSVKGNTQPPIDFELWYDAVVLYGAFIAGSGPNLTPQNIQNALFGACGSHYCPKAGIPRPYDFNLGFGPAFPDGENSTVKDFELVRWDPNATSPFLRDVKNNQSLKGSYVPYSANVGWTRLRTWGHPS